MENTLCSKCNKLPAERGYELALCGRCRNAASRYPVPLWVITLLLPLALPVLYGLWHTPVWAMQAYQRGHLAEVSGQFDVAEQQYGIVLTAYPDSPVARARLGIVQYKAGHYQDAATTLNQLNGRKVMPWVANEVMSVAPDIQSKLNAAGGQR